MIALDPNGKYTALDVDGDMGLSGDNRQPAQPSDTDIIRAAIQCAAALKAGG